jgi:uncharacterized protein YpmB
MKILDNAVITKRGLTKACIYNDKCPHYNKGNAEILEYNTIDKDCPLQDVEVIEGKDLIELVYGKDEYPKLSIVWEDKKDVDKIIIVKKKQEGV